MKFSSILYRIYSDYVMSDRIYVFEELIRLARENDYIFSSISEIHETMRSGIEIKEKTIILRHDIDTDIKTARKMWEVEKSNGVISSWFFRLSTINTSLMKELHAGGCDVGYHYEEIASWCKRKQVKDVEKVMSSLPEIRSEYMENLNRLRHQTGLPMTIAASHGDFVNRLIKLPNWHLLSDAGFRKSANIELEVYDENFMSLVSDRFSDTSYPEFWKPSSPIDAIKNGSKMIYILVHPRHWHANLVVNLKDDLFRFKEGIRYK